MDRACAPSVATEAAVFYLKQNTHTAVIPMTLSSFTLMAICAAATATHLELFAACDSQCISTLHILLLFIGIARSISTHRDHILV